MKSPSELKQRLRRQWEYAATRESRLLGGADAWPIVLSIGKPKPSVMLNDLDSVKRHVEAWRKVADGDVIWEAIKYRATAEPVEVPLQWKLHRPTEWLSACSDAKMRGEFSELGLFVEQADSVFHNMLVRQRSLWREKSVNEVVQATRLAIALEPGCANGQPLRTLSLEGIDTKFFERNSRLVTALLDIRFDEEVSRLGLEVFLGALVEGDHWLLLIDMDGGLLPFRKQRVASSDLKSVKLPGTRVLIVENETCHHQLPELPGTVAILGAGFDLGWTESSLFDDKQVGYWGDIDTWGLQFLAQARRNIKHLHALLMTSDLFESHRDAAVHEPVVAGTDCPGELTASEQQLYSQLISEPMGRLEQEFLSTETIHRSILDWADAE
jgi:hypothetical protein